MSTFSLTRTLRHWNMRSPAGQRPLACSVNGLNQSNNAWSVSLTYGVNGNLITDGTSTYAYDAENRLDVANDQLAYGRLGRLRQIAEPSA